MMESSFDIHELEQLRCENTVTKDTNKSQIKDTKKCRILLEPALVGAMMAINLGQTSIQNFYLQTACMVDLGYPAHQCLGKMNSSIEAESQTIVSGVNISRSFVGCLLATVVLLFVGPWSDCSGRRKPLLLMPLTGMSVMTTAILCMITFPGFSTVQVLYAVQIPISLGGNFGLLLAAAFSHIGDICHATGRDVTRTMGTHRAAIQVANVLGAVCGPLLYRTFGFYGVFPIVLLLQLSSLTYVILVVKDVNVNKENKVSVFNWRLPFNAVHCLLRPREDRKRLVILLMLGVAIADRIILSAEVLIYYMYTRYKFGWDDILFGSFFAYRNIISFFGTLIILSVLKRRLKVSDEIVGVLSCCSYVLASFGLMQVQTTLCVFALPLIGIISQGSQVVQRPILNKQILASEQGKIYSVTGALESATQTFSSPLYSLLYKKTVSRMPDAWLIPGICLASLQFIAYLLTRISTRNVQETKKSLYATEKPLLNSPNKKDSENSPIVKNIPSDPLIKDIYENLTEKEKYKNNSDLAEKEKVKDKSDFKECTSNAQLDQNNLNKNIESVTTTNVDK